MKYPCFATLGPGKLASHVWLGNGTATFSGWLWQFALPLNTNWNSTTTEMRKQSLESHARGNSILEPV